MTSDVLWTPSTAAAGRSSLARFMKQQGFSIAEYRDLHAWSTSDLSGFWSALWDFADIPGEQGQVAFVPDEGAWMTGARFFPEGRLNLAEVLLRGRSEDVVVHARNEAASPDP